MIVDCEMVLSLVILVGVIWSGGSTFAINILLNGSSSNGETDPSGSVRGFVVRGPVVFLFTAPFVLATPFLGSPWAALVAVPLCVWIALMWQSRRLVDRDALAERDLIVLGLTLRAEEGLRTAQKLLVPGSLLYAALLIVQLA